MSQPDNTSRQSPDRDRLSWWLLAAAVMLVTIGFTNMETPRLWIPFMPLLLLGAALQLRVFRDTGGQARLLLAVLVLVQTACSATQWSFLDAREAETRLSTTTPRYFD